MTQPKKTNRHAVALRKHHHRFLINDSLHSRLQHPTAEQLTPAFSPFLFRDLLHCVRPPACNLILVSTMFPKSLPLSSWHCLRLPPSLGKHVPQILYQRMASIQEIHGRQTIP
ncbi:hypothetical protein MPTK1_7g19660 [Marchantia polymorpha subsp. ruderalis]|uniref:Uncharacterized protein n=2 Tax=Marchantia polymorpha TaxID=3197 RepID=A0AAF6C1I3_MARPO|nr:hypothetical protein MARPO_0067s0011 [Marchantia polymorpha]BBN18117.1 hypothetical protein Mp_7g19660 [Marchantia polymorpha subsp. ruderalis]|eukprot:PTQ35916.1 hypothetical protein MARPO_0067s0011 [Marchantia polymorpha]